jgi:leucyl/phenylalanyl-tRNA--protein transferase
MAALALPWLTDELAFPHPDFALAEPNGLLCAGGDLSVERLLFAYRHGIFPWYNKGEPILWWSPDPRCVIFPGQLHVSRSLLKLLRKPLFNFSFDRAFVDVIEACRQPRRSQQLQQAHHTWITDEMKDAYIALHQRGYAHSVECWQDKTLVGGIYGVVLGKCFFGESMFSIASNASKAVLVELDQLLQQNHFVLLDCQVSSSHVMSMGAVEIPRQQFLQLIDEAVT